MQGFTLHHMYKSGTSRLIYDPIWAARVIFKKFQIHSIFGITMGALKLTCHHLCILPKKFEHAIFKGSLRISMHTTS